MEEVLTPDFRAHLHYYSEAEGGLRIPISDEFRPSLYFAQLDASVFVSQEFPETNIIYAGDTVDAEIGLVDKTAFVRQLYTGCDFNIYHGEQVIGSGVILEILNSELQN